MKRGKIPGAIQKGHKAMLRPLAIRGAGSTPPGELQSKNSESIHQNSLQLGVMYPGEEESRNPRITFACQVLASILCFPRLTQ